MVAGQEHLGLGFRSINADEVADVQVVGVRNLAGEILSIAEAGSRLANRGLVLRRAE